MANDAERSLEIGGIYFQLFGATERFDADTPGSEEKFDSLMRRLEGLDLSQVEIDKMIVATERNPTNRSIHKALFVDNPTRPGETRRAHLERVFGQEGRDASDELCLP